MFDEPSLGLAPNIVERTFAIIRGIRDAGTTVLLVEQNAFAALEMCDHAYLLEGGRIVLSGPGAEHDRERARAKGLSWRMSGRNSGVVGRQTMDAGLRAQPADFANDRLRPRHRRRFDPGLERRTRGRLRTDVPARTGRPQSWTPVGRTLVLPPSRGLVRSPSMAGFPTAGRAGRCGYTRSGSGTIRSGSTLRRSSRRRTRTAIRRAFGRYRQARRQDAAAR